MLENISKKRLLLFLYYLVLWYSQKRKDKETPTIEEIKRFYRKMISILESAYQDKVIEIWEYNMLLEIYQSIFRCKRKTMVYECCSLSGRASFEKFSGENEISGWAVSFSGQLLSVYNIV